jgi:catechol 2,3-dioxygenase-like lactoylglutathione lyase family enzyme
MPDRPHARLSATVLGTPDPGGLARFYAALLDWVVVRDEPDWAMIRSAGERWRGLSFQLEPEHVRPVWPSAPGDQQMQMHLDIGVDDLETAVAYAVGLGATLAEHQPEHDIRVLLDPAGHPFCLFTEP